MQKITVFLAAVLLFPSMALLLPACSCGFDCNNDDSKGTAVLTLGFSDALPEDLKQVVIEVDSITFRRTGAEDVVVDRFTIDGASVDTFQVDLLLFRGRNQFTVLDDFELESGTYSQVRIAVLGGDVNRSYVQEADDTLRAISVAGGVLALPGMKLAKSSQTFTVEFGLAQSLQRQSSGDYLLAADGVRLMDNATAASLSGRVDSSLFDSESPCSEKSDPAAGNRIYIYQGSKSASDQLGDVFTSNSATEVPDGVVAPYAVASLVRNSLTGRWDYVFGYLPAGDYTLAFACDTATDDSVDFDGLVVPLPAAQLYPLKLSAGEEATCDLKESGSC